MNTSSFVNSSVIIGTSGAVAADLTEIRKWIETIHGTPDGNSDGYININSDAGPGRTPNWDGRTFTDPVDAANYAHSLDRDLGVYMRTTTLSQRPDQGKRGGDVLSKMLPGYAADIDMPSPARKHNKPLPLVPDIESGFLLVAQSGLPEPTLWVNSGWGLYPWWLFNQGLDLTDPDNMSQAKTISDKFQATLGRWAEHMGWDYGTGVKDMSRVLRIPGTVNRKVEGDHRPCHILVESSSYTYYDFDEFASAVLTAYDQAPVPVSYKAPKTSTAPRTDNSSLRPGDDFNDRGSWLDILPQHGWVLSRPPSGRTLYWRRPGKDWGTSATTGHDPLADRLYVFSTSTEFEALTPINKHYGLAVLEFGGDVSAATRYLRGQGFGGEFTPTQQQAKQDLSGLVRPATSLVRRDEPMNDHEPEPAALVIQADPLPVSHVDTLPEVLPEIDLGSEQEAMVEIVKVISTGLIPHLYVKDGVLVHVHPKTNAQCSEVAVQVVTADLLNLLLAQHVRTFKWASGGKDNPPVRKACAPMISALRAVTANSYWPDVKPLTGILGTPTLRPDGSLIQECGYDETTGLYLAPAVKISKVPDKITDDQVRTSREFIFSKVFGEFCWSTPGDFANYLALLLSPMMRPYVKTTTPFGMITATTRGSGKTNLTDAIGMVYGQSSQVLSGRGEELQKKITSILACNTSPVIVFDNVREGTSISSEILATLITKESWDDRLLGASRTIEARNDRLWLASGNGLGVGGDMASRTVMVRLDPKMARPELRQFEMGQFSDWIREPGNREDLLYHLLILVQAWMQSGGTFDTDHTMRGFTRWAQIMGGLLKFHGLTGFLANADDLAARDTDEEEWLVFLAKWHEIFGPQAKTSRELHASAQVDWVMGSSVDRWAKCFITDDDGMTPTTKRLGDMLAGHRDRIYGSYVMRSKRNKTTNCTEWWVERMGRE